MIYTNKYTGEFADFKVGDVWEIFNGQFKINDRVNDLRTNEIIRIGEDDLKDFEFFSPMITMRSPEADLHTPGAKDDALKPMPQVVLGGFANALKAVTEIGTHGARKYSRDGWLSVENAEDRYMGALLRHLLEHMSGTTIDEESGFTHLRHLAWNALALVELNERKTHENQTK